MLTPKREKSNNTRQMTSSTEMIVKAALAADPSVSPQLAREIIETLKTNGSSAVAAKDDGDIVLTRAQVAVMINKSVKAVDIYGRRGVFKRVYFNNGRTDLKRRQSQGYSRASVLSAIRNGMCAHQD